MEDTPKLFDNIVEKQEALRNSAQFDAFFNMLTNTQRAVLAKYYGIELLSLSQKGCLYNFLLNLYLSERLDFLMIKDNKIKVFVEKVEKVELLEEKIRLQPDLHQEILLRDFFTSEQIQEIRRRVISSPGSNIELRENSGEIKVFLVHRDKTKNPEFVIQSSKL